jgi:hypothetical protein
MQLRTLRNDCQNSRNQGNVKLKVFGTTAKVTTTKRQLLSLLLLPLLLLVLLLLLLLLLLCLLVNISFEEYSYGKSFGSKIASENLRLFSSQTFSRMNTPTFLKPSHSTPTCLWRWNRQCSEMSANKIQTPGNYPEESIKHSEQGESLKTRKFWSVSRIA